MRRSSVKTIPARRFAPSPTVARCEMNVRFGNRLHGGAAHRSSLPGPRILTRWDWDISLTAQADLLLDRTPFTTWGGYGGLTVPRHRNWQKTRLLFADGSTNDRPTPVPSSGATLRRLRRRQGHHGGIAMFDDPRNIRHPSPWYGATGAGHYFNAAFLFNEPLNVQAGETLRFRYRVLGPRWHLGRRPAERGVPGVHGRAGRRC